MGIQVFETWCNELHLLTTEKTQIRKSVMSGHSLGSFLLRNVIQSGAFYFCHLTCTRDTQRCVLRHRQWLRNIRQSRASSSVQLATASTFQGRFCRRETKGCRLWRLAASGLNFCSFYETGLRGRILHIVTIFQGGKFWEALQYSDKPNLKNCDRWISRCWKLWGLFT